MAATLTTLEDLGTFPAAPPARPRVLLIGTVLAIAAAAMAFAGMLGWYLHVRAETIAGGDPWLPEGVTIPLTPGTMGLITLAMSCVTMLWAVYAIGNDDRRSTWLAMGLTLLLGGAELNLMGFYYSQMHLAAASPQGVLIYAITGAFLAMLGAAMLFVLVTVFRTLGGQYSAKDREGVVAATLFWYATVAVYAVIWYAIFVTK
jgi:cytochrome c oxidase subunit 3